MYCRCLPTVCSLFRTSRRFHAIGIRFVHLRLVFLYDTQGVKRRTGTARLGIGYFFTFTYSDTIFHS
jgi:hypothetical protein